MQVRGKVIGTGESREDAAARMMGATGHSTHAAPPKGPGVVEGFLMALGAAPVLLAVLLLASWLEAKMLQREAGRAVQEIRRALP